MTHYPLNWSLESLGPVPTKAEFTPVLTELKGRLQKCLEQFQAAQPFSEQTCTDWKPLLSEFFDVAEHRHQLDALVSCYCAGDALNTEYRHFEGELVNLSASIQLITMLLELQMKSLSEESLLAIYTKEPELQQLELYFADLLTRSDLRLTAEKEELAIELSVDSQLAWSRVYDRLSGELKISIQEPEGLVEKSPGQVQFDDPSRKVRQTLYETTDRAWRTIASGCAEALNHLSGTRLTRYKHAGLQDHLDAPLIYNRMQRETLTAMWDAVETKKQSLANYLKRKAQLMGLESLHWYDLTAPLPVASSSGVQCIDYQTGCEQIIKAFHGFSTDLGEFAQMSLSEGWIEAESRSGKRQGGFCTDLPQSKESRIFMTYNDNLDSLSTLAHELGHAYHTWILRNEPFVLQQYPMSLAETASTFAEAVVNHAALNQTKSVGDRLLRLSQMCDDSVAFLMNIHARFLFEDRYHHQRQQGELSVEQFDELMHQAQSEAYAGGLSEQGTNRSFWISKLHFYIGSYPFYNFPYTFGYLLSQGLFRIATKQPDGFSERYCQFLLATGGMTVEAAVQKSFGYDLREQEFWSMALESVQDHVDQFEQYAQIYTNWREAGPQNG